MQKIPKVSVILPTRNEEKYVSVVLHSLIDQDYPKENIEILIIDGMSKDNTRKIIEEYQQKCPFVKLLDNPRIFTPFAFNSGIKNATGDIVIFMGAHTTYSSNYISTISKYLSDDKADCVGSVAQTLPRDRTATTRAIALALSSPFGVGNSYMRIGSKEIRYGDTASCPGYKKEVFNRIGLFNENLLHSQDMEFNLRLKKAGGKILLVPEIVSYYYARSDLKSFWRHNFRNGLWAIYPLKFVKHFPVSWRHLIPLVFVFSLISSAVLSLFFKIFFWLFLLIVGLYFLSNLFFSSKITIREKNLWYLLVMPLIFATLHIGYGIGSVWGAIKVSVAHRFWKNLRFILKGG